LSDLHSEKHDDPKTSTLRGISIDSNEVDENALDSIRVNREFDSNEIDLSDLHSEKHDDPRTSTLHGITIDSSDEDENAQTPICVNRDRISNEM
jgi:hypothetical protein